MVAHDRRDNVGLLALLLPKPPFGNKRHLNAAGRVRAGHRPGPDPRDNGRLAAVGKLGPGVEVANATVGLLAHPLPVAAHVLGQAVGARPGAGAVVGAGEHGRAPGEARRDLNERLVNEDGHGVEVRGPGLEAEALRLQGDRSASREGVEDRRGLAVRRTEDLLPGLPQQVLVPDAVPVHQAGDEGEQPLPLGEHRAPGRRVRVGLAAGGRRLAELLVALRGVVHQLGEEDRPRCGRRLPRPPQVEC